MRRCWITVALLAGCGRAAVPADLAPDADQTRVTVLTWNLGRIHGKWDSRAGDAAIEAVTALVARTRPDFVALQELRGPGQLARLRARLGGAWDGAIADGQGYDRYTALLVRDELRARFTTVASLRRAWQAARVTLPGGARATVVSVHLDALHARRRATQAEALAAWADAAQADAVILAGDFNLDADRAADAGARDPDLAAWRLLMRKHRDLGRDAGGTTLLGQRLDYLLLRAPRLRRARVTVLPGLRTEFMDHDPVFGVFLLDRSPLLL